MTWHNNIVTSVSASAEDTCENLTDPDNEDLNNQVQAKVNDWQLYKNYMYMPSSLVSLYLGPLSGDKHQDIIIFASDIKVQLFQIRVGSP